MRIITSLIILATCCVSQPIAAAGISVTGKGAVEQVPDTFVMRLSISARGKSASKTKKNVDLKVQNVLSAIKRFNIEERDITSSQISIHPIYHRSANKHIRTENVYVANTKDEEVAIAKTTPEINRSKMHTELEFDVNRAIEIKLRDFSLYEKLLDRVTKLGVNRISPAQKSIANAEEHYQRALELAVIDAKNKAGKLAKQLGVKRGVVVNIEELSYGAPRKILMESSSFSSRGLPETSPGTQTITAEVKVTFAISP